MTILKIGFSNVGCPDWTLSEILSTAKDLHYDGVELRGLGKDLYLPDAPAFSPNNLKETAARIKDSGIEIACLSSDCTLHLSDRDYEAMTRKYIGLSRVLSCPYVRVLGDTWGYPGDNVDTGLVEQRLKALAPAAEEAGVTLLVETNGVYANTAKLKELIESVGSSRVMVLWDINHPVRYFDEEVETTWKNIGSYIRHVHMKDSVRDGDLLAYKMLGYGDLPVRQVARTLKASGYNGYLSLEWIKRWNEELEDAGIAFSHYVYMMKKIWEEM